MGSTMGLETSIEELDLVTILVYILVNLKKKFGGLRPWYGVWSNRSSPQVYSIKTKITSRS